MWYKGEQRYVLGRGYNRRRDSGRNLILMVDARLSDRSKNMHRVGGLVLLGLVLAGFTWFGIVGARHLRGLLFSENGRFVIRNLDLVSDGKLDPRHLREYAHVSEGMNLFAVDLRKVRQDLESVPIVDSVAVTRRLPDTLIVRVKERVAAARLGEDTAGYALALDRDGYVLGPSSSARHLPAISGYRARELRPGSRVGDRSVRGALHVLELCDLPKLSRLLRVKSIDVSHPDFLDVRLVRGERVLLSHEGVEVKLERLCDIIRHTADAGQAIASIDMTVDRNFPIQYQ